MNISFKVKIIFGTAIVLLVLAGVGIYLTSEQTVPSKEFAYKRGSPVIPRGIQTYEFLQSSRVSPRIRSLTVDPLDAKPGETQRFKVAVEGKLPVVSVSLDIEDDVEVSNFKLVKADEGEMPKSRYFVGPDNNLALTPQTENPSSTIFYWSGERVVKNASDSKFSINIVAKESIPSDEASRGFERLGIVSLEWNKVCEIPFGGDWSLSESCIVSYVDGVDRGSAHIQNYSTLVLDADFGMNADKAIIFQPLGIIAVNTKAKIVQGSIWKLKSDEDGTKEVISPDSPGRSYKRRSDFEVGIKSVFRDIDKEKKMVALPEGRQIFQIASAAKTGPKIIQADIDPLDVRVGDTQKLSLVVQGSVEIISVVAKIETDNEILELPLSLVGPTPKTSLLRPRYGIDEQGQLAFLGEEGVNDFAGIPGIRRAEASSEDENFTYSGSWVVRDTHSARYHTRFIVKDASGAESSVLMAWSDPCGTFTAGARTFTSCTLSDTDGADHGILTVATGHNIAITSSGDLIFNSGYSLVLSGTATISIAAGGEIRQTYLWYRDGDVDSFPTGGLQAADTAPTNARRAYLTANPADCYDFDPNAYPSSEYYSRYDRGDGSFDYNCDGMNSPLIPGDDNSVQVCADFGGCVITNYSTVWCSEGGNNYGICTNSDPGCGGYSYLSGGSCNVSCWADVTGAYQECN